MSQEQAWILEEMARSIRAERLAAAEQYRVVTAVPGSYSSPRTVLANALRWLATRVDERPVANPKPEPRLVRAF
jgi:hypothetical protein